MYYINGRYYEDEVGQFVTPDYSSINPLVIGGLNPYGLGVSNPLMFGVNPDNYFSALSLYSDVPTPGSSGPNWLSWILSGVQFAAGVGLMFVPGGQGIGAMMITGGALGLAGNAFGSQIGGGLSSMANGAGAFATGLSLLGYGPVGWVGGGILMAVGAGTAIMGANEVYAGATGTNAMRDWMGGGKYDGLYLGLNIGSAVGQIAGNIYMNSAAGRLAHEIQQNARYWDRGTFRTRYGSLKYHYGEHGGGIGPTAYTQKALDFASRNASMLRYTYNYKYNNTSWNFNYSRVLGGQYTGAGKIRTFWWF